MYVDGLKEELDDFILELEDCELSKNSLSIYKINIQYFIKFLEDKKISFFKKQDYIDFRTHLKEKYKISTVNKYIVIINKYLKFLGYENLKIKQLKVQRKQSVENVPNTKDYKRILRAAKKNNEETYWMIQTISYTGIRVSELSFITVENLKQSKKEKIILIFNKNKHREIIVPSWLRRELLKYAKKKNIKTGYIFPSPKDKTKPMPRSTVWRRIQKVTGLSRVSLKKGHPHAFRHLFGKQYLEYSNGDFQQLADILGHNSVNTSMIYTQLSREEKAKNIDEFRIKGE